MGVIRDSLNRLSRTVAKSTAPSEVRTSWASVYTISPFQIVLEDDLTNTPRAPFEVLIPPDQLSIGDRVHVTHYGSQITVDGTPGLFTRLASWISNVSSTAISAYNKANALEFTVGQQANQIEDLQEKSRKIWTTVVSLNPPAAGSSRDTTINLPLGRFSSAPVVSILPVGPAFQISSLGFAVTARSSTGVTIRITNNSTTNFHSISGHLIAIEEE